MKPEQPEVSDDKVAQALAKALREVFGENENARRFVDISRIPLICQSITDMHKSIEKIESNINWIVKLIVGAVVVALIALVIK